MFTKTNVVFLCIICLVTGFGYAQDSIELSPGTTPPKLSSAQWVNTGGINPKSLSSFERDKVYVVEFWSTDCVGAVPAFLHLASLKQSYAKQDVRFLLLTHESGETVRSFLKGSAQTPDGQSVPYEQLASTLAIGLDPNRSGLQAYLGKDPAGQLPWTFLIGRDGKVEWHGHPSELDMILDAVVAGKWDRHKIERDQQFMAEVQESLAKLTKARDWPGAIRELDRFRGLTDDPRITFGLLKSKIEIYARSGSSSAEITEVVKELFSICREEPLFAHDVANTVYQLAMRGHLKDRAAIAYAVEGLNVAIGQIDDGSTKSGMLHTLAKLEGLIGKTDQAIAHQTQAIELADDSQKPALKAFLAKLTSQSTAPR